MTKRTTLSSRALSAASWDDGYLTVEFANGQTWRYRTPERTYHELCSATSAGSFFAKHLRKLPGSRA